MLRDHAAIGDRSTVALVASDATIDWWSPDALDAPASLFSLLDNKRGGAVRIRPNEPRGPGEQFMHASGAPIVSTVVHDREGSVEVTDHLSKGTIVRVLTGRSGRPTITVQVSPGDAFGDPRKVKRWSHGVSFGRLVVRGPAVDQPITLGLGEQVVFTITTSDEGSVTHTAEQFVQPSIGEAMVVSSASSPK